MAHIRWAWYAIIVWNWSTVHQCVIIVCPKPGRACASLSTHTYMLWAGCGGGVALSSNLLLKVICAPVLVVDSGRGANAMLYHTYPCPSSGAVASWFLVTLHPAVTHVDSQVLNGGAAHEFQWHMSLESPSFQYYNLMSDGLETLNQLYITHLHWSWQEYSTAGQTSERVES